MAVTERSYQFYGDAMKVSRKVTDKR